MKKEKILSMSSEEMSLRMTHLPNELHRDACLRRAGVVKSKKIYTRKDKHKKDYRNW